MPINKFNIDNILLLIKEKDYEVSSCFEDSVFQRLAKHSTKKISKDITAILSVIVSLTIVSLLMIFTNINSTSNTESYSLYRSEYVNRVAVVYSLNDNSYNNLR